MAIFLSSVLIPRRGQMTKQSLVPLLGFLLVLLGKPGLSIRRPFPATDTDPSKASGTITG